MELGRKERRLEAERNHPPFSRWAHGEWRSTFITPRLFCCSVTKDLPHPLHKGMLQYQYWFWRYLTAAEVSSLSPWCSAKISQLEDQGYKHALKSVRCLEFSKDKATISTIYHGTGSFPTFHGLIWWLQVLAIGYASTMILRWQILLDNALLSNTVLCCAIWISYGVV